MIDIDRTTGGEDANGASSLGLGGLGELPCTNYALRRAARQLGILYDETLAPIDLKATQLGLLLSIEGLGGEEGPTLQTVAAQLGVGISALTHALRPLMRDGLVDLEKDARDRRSKRAILTTAGRERLRQGGHLWAQANQRLETLLGPEDAKLLRTLAERVSSEAFSRAFKSDLGPAKGQE